MILEPDVENVGQRVLLATKRGGERGGGGAARLAIGIVQKRQDLRLVERAGLAVESDVHGEAPGDLIEQARPGTAASVGGFVKDVLLALGPSVRLGAPLAFEQVRERLEPLVRHERPGGIVVDLDPLQLEEEQMPTDRGGALLSEADQPPKCGLVALGGVQEMRVDAGGVHELMDVLQLGHGLVQLSRVEVGDLAAVALLKGLGTALGGIEVGLELGVVDAGIEGRQIPRDAVGAAGRRGRLDGHRRVSLRSAGQFHCEPADGRCRPGRTPPWL